MLPRHILVPTDLSEDAEQAIDYACELARKIGAQVHLLNVIGIPAMGVPELGLAMNTTMIDQMAGDNELAIEQLARTRCGDVRGQVLVRTGDARDVINQTAKEIGADLIVIGTHGRTGLSRALLGSTAETVVRTAPCPVLTVRISDEVASDQTAA